jgi:DNA-binding NtrC family response regulator
MPGMSGLELLAELRRTRPQMPVIMCTGATTPDSLQQAEALGALAILAKPFSHNDLVSLVRTHLGFDSEGHSGAATLHEPGHQDDRSDAALAAEIPSVLGVRAEASYSGR